MKQTRRILSVILALVMLLAAVPVMKTEAVTIEQLASYVEGLIGTSAKEWGSGTGTQCVELPKYYLDNYFGLSTKRTAMGNGNEIYKNVASQFPDLFQRIDYYNGFTPMPGDIISFHSSSSPKEGHAAIVYSVSGNRYSIAEQWNGSGTVRSNTKTVTEGQYGVSYTIIGVARPYCQSPFVNIPNGFYTIQSVRNPDKVLDIQGNENRDGANIQLYDNVGTTVQKFWIEKTSDYYTIKNVYTKRWLDISSPYDTDGCNIQLWNSNTRTEQKWRFEDAGNGNVYIHSLYGMYVDTDGGNTYNGANVETYHFDGTTSQQWRLIRTSGSDKLNITEGVYVIHNVRDSSKVLDIQENSTETGANIQLYDDVNTTVQQFRIVKNGDYYSLQSVYSNDWLDIARPCDEDGCNIQLWFKDTVKEQNWTFEDAGNGNVYIRSLYGMYIDTDGGATSNNTNVETFHFDGSTSQQWRLHRVYNVMYNANNGTGAPAKQYKEANINLTLSSTKPSRAGYTFVKWNTKADGTGTSYNSGATYSGNADLTLYAIWQPATYQINYNYNGGTAGPTSQTKVHGQDLVLSTVIPSRVGYAFQNWNTKLNGTGTVYMPGDTYKANEAATLYAAWKTCTHTWNSGTVVNAATCTATGTKNVICTICGATGTETIPVNASNHVNTTNVTATASTCTVKGYTAGVYCNDCKKYISGHQEQPLAAHQTELRNAREATCTSEGYTGDQYCTVCKQTISTGTTIGKKAHTLTTINKKDAGCTTTGYTGDQYCMVCKQTISKGSATNALGHTSPDGNGNCTRCGTHIKDVTPPQPQPNPNACKYCGEVHSGPFGWLIKFFHSILAIFKR